MGGPDGRTLAASTSTEESMRQKSNISKRSVAIVGGGFGGVGAAIKLREAGYDDVTIFERGERLGGVWHHNTYPGCACDVPSALYSFSFAPNPDWSRRFLPQPEIREYIERVAREHGALECARLGTEVLEATWDEARGKWVLATSAGSFEADVLVAACGQLTNPSIPPIPGLDSFDGPVMHTARWDSGVQLEGKRIGVVGTGASAIQAVPEIAKVAGHLDVFQIDAPWTLPKPDRRYSALLSRLFRRFPAALRAERRLAFWLNEYATMAYTTLPRLRPLIGVLSRAQRRWQVRDPELRRKVEPGDTIGCKRVLLTSDWYPALSKPHVELVTDRIVSVTPEGPVTEDGKHHPADVLVLGTGFKTQQFVMPMVVTGRDGRTLTEAWAGRPKAHLGTTVPGFPNMFLLYGPNTNVGAGSVVDVLEADFAQLVLAMRAMDDAGAATIEISERAADAFDAECQAALRETVWAAGCASWYVDAEGNNPNNWPWTARAYRRRLSAPVAGEFELRIRQATPAAADV